MLWHSLERVMSESSQSFIEVPSREFQLFFRNYPQTTYPKEEYTYGVNLGRCECYSHRNSENEIIGIFEHWNNFELHSRYFIRADLKEYVNDKENFGKYDSNNQWQFDLQWQYWVCPHCHYKHYIEPPITPPDECPKCHARLSHDKYKGAWIDSELDSYSHDELCDAIILLRRQINRHREALKQLTGCPYFGDSMKHKECHECLNSEDKRYDYCWITSSDVNRELMKQNIINLKENK